VKATSFINEPLELGEIQDVRAMLSSCYVTFLGKRNRAILLFLLDIDLRARELLSIDLENVDFIAGNILLSQGKDGKPRTVFIGK
jgi:integrase